MLWKVRLHSPDRIVPGCRVMMYQLGNLRMFLKDYGTLSDALQLIMCLSEIPTNAPFKTCLRAACTKIMLIEKKITWNWPAVDQGFCDWEWYLPLPCLRRSPSLKLGRLLPGYNIQKISFNCTAVKGRIIHINVWHDMGIHFRFNVNQSIQSQPTW